MKGVDETLIETTALKIKRPVDDKWTEFIALDSGNIGQYINTDALGTEVQTIKTDLASTKNSVSTLDTQVTALAQLSTNLNTKKLDSTTAANTYATKAELQDAIGDIETALAAI